jgi:uncharacterized peroxidase-related enzyme
MAFIDTIAPDAATGPLAAMYQRQQSFWGFVPNYAKVFCHRPEVMARWGALLAEIKRPMDPRRFELVTFAAAHELRNTACALAHGKRLREFFTDDAIVAIAQGRLHAEVSDAEQAVLHFARQVARDAAHITQDDVDTLAAAAGIDDGEVFDIAATAAGRAFFTKVLDALGAPADSPFLALEAALRDPLIVGRAIDAGVVVTMPSGEPAGTGAVQAPDAAPSRPMGRR